MENKIDGIMSIRNIKKEAFRDVVYEWEEDISKFEKISLINVHKPFLRQIKNNTVNKIADNITRHRAYNSYDNKKKLYVAFITVLSDLEFVIRSNCIPIFLDLGLGQVDYIAKTMRKGMPFFVTSMNFHNALKKKYPELKAYYMPLMISERWNNQNDTEKKYDIIQMGRKNPVLHEYALHFINEHPEYEYVYSDSNGTLGSMQYYSSKTDCIGAADTREEYMRLLRSSKICLVSSPGIDNPKKWVIGMDFPTPRFYEAAICKCHIIGRYIKNEEFLKQKIDSVTKYPESYDEFEEYVLDILTTGMSIKNDIYNDYIRLHSSDTWWKEFKLILDDISL